MLTTIKSELEDELHMELDRTLTRKVPGPLRRAHHSILTAAHLGEHIDISNQLTRDLGC